MRHKDRPVTHAAVACSSATMTDGPIIDLPPPWWSEYQGIGGTVRVLLPLWRSVLLGFKWSSQHLERGGCDGHGHSEAAFGSVRAKRVALAWPALCCAA